MSVETGKTIIKFVILLHTPVLASYLYGIILITCQKVVAWPGSVAHTPMTLVLKEIWEQ